MKIEVNIDKKHLIILIVIVGLLIVTGLTIAFGGNDPQTRGHSFGELQGVQAAVTGNCIGQVIVEINPTTGAVTCEPDNGRGSLVQCIRAIGQSCNLCIPPWGTVAGPFNTPNSPTVGYVCAISDTCLA